MKKTNFFRHFVETLPAMSLLGMLLLAPMGASAQVTIGSGDLPQATLDIIGETGKTGEAFRMIDGNQADGKVLTVDGNNGVATWKYPALTILQSRYPQPETGKSVVIKDYASPSTIFIDTDDYIDLEPGKYMIFTNMPVFFNFGFEALETVAYRVVLTDGAGKWSGLMAYCQGPMRANVLIRHITVFTIDTSSDTAITRYYVGYSDFTYSNATGANVTTTHPNAATNGASFIRRDIGGYVYAIPMGQ